MATKRKPVKQSGSEAKRLKSDTVTHPDEGIGAPMDHFITCTDQLLYKNN